MVINFLFSSINSIHPFFKIILFFSLIFDPVDAWLVIRDVINSLCTYTSICDSDEDDFLKKKSKVQTYSDSFKFNSLMTIVRRFVLRLILLPECPHLISKLIYFAVDASVSYQSNLNDSSKTILEWIISFDGFFFFNLDYNGFYTLCRIIFSIYRVWF